MNYYSKTFQEAYYGADSLIYTRRHNLLFNPHFGMWGHIADVITKVKFQVDLSDGLGATGCQNLVFPIPFPSSLLQQCYALPCLTVVNLELKL